jgi:hypothetical protein
VSPDREELRRRAQAAHFSSNGDVSYWADMVLELFDEIERLKSAGDFGKGGEDEN